MHECLLPHGPNCFTNKLSPNILKRWIAGFRTFSWSRGKMLGPETKWQWVRGCEYTHCLARVHIPSQLATGDRGPP